MTAGLMATIQCYKSLECKHGHTVHSEPLQLYHVHALVHLKS